MQKTSKRLLELDSLRGIAAIAVVLYHYTYQFNTKFGLGLRVPFSFEMGHLGVQLFFIISGFVILKTIEGSKKKYDFAISRFSRLYPTYWVALFLTLSVLLVHPIPDWNISLKDVVFNLTMLQDSIPGINHIDGVYWTLGIELKFYFFVYVLFLLGKIQKIEHVGLVFVILSFIVSIAFNSNPESFYLRLSRSVLLGGYSNLFFAGVLFYLVHKSGSFNLSTILLLACCAIYELFVRDFTSFLAVLFFFFFFFLFVTQRLKILVNPIFLYFGTISYSLYLVHQNIGYSILYGFLKNGYNNELLFLVPIIVSVIIATVITFVIEQPMALFVKNKCNWIVDTWIKRGTSEESLIDRGSNDIKLEQ